MNYLPFSSRVPDMQYEDLLRRILNNGINVMPQQESPARMVVGHTMRYDLQNGFPLLTLRDLATPLKSGARSIFHQALGELFCFLNGGRTLEDLAKFGCTWWNSWATEEKCRKRGLEPGDLGPGSYGPGWCSVPDSSGESFDQIPALIQQIEERPHLRTHFIDPWRPQFIFRISGRTQKVVVAPCHGWVHVFVFPERKELSLHMFQRSGDVPVGIVSNIVQYAALTMMIAHVAGYSPRYFIHTISDAHIYHMQLEKVMSLLGREARAFPTITLDPAVKDIREFRQEHFRVADYHPHPKMFIPTPV